MSNFNFSSKKDVEEFKENLLTLDSEFCFKCRKCGKCCTHQHTILLNARDIFRIARKQGKTMKAVISECAETYIGENSCIPVVHLLPRGKREECPFLKEGRCSIHECKPSVCALYPLGRVLLVEDPENATQKTIKYIMNDHSCGSRKQKHTVREWLSRFGIPEQDDFFLLWNNTLLSLSRAFRSLSKQGIPEEQMNTLWNIVYTGLYLDYDTNKDFMPQFQASAEKLLALSSILSDWGVTEDDMEQDDPIKKEQ